MQCHECHIPMEKQPAETPEAQNTVPVYPYKCPACGRTEFEPAQTPVGAPVGFGEWPLLNEDLVAQAKARDEDSLPKD
jgi:hypothetical protein